MPAPLPVGPTAGVREYAVENREEYGVWAGVKLPGGQYRKRQQLAGPTRSCAGSPRAKSAPGDWPRTPRCWPAANRDHPGHRNVLHLPIARSAPVPPPDSARQPQPRTG